MLKRRKQKLENKVNWEFAVTWSYTSDCSNILLCKPDLWNGQCLDQGSLGQDGHCPLHRHPSGASSAGSDDRLELSPTHLMNKTNAGQNHLEIEFKSCSFSAFFPTFFPSLPPPNILYRVYIHLIFLFKLLAISGCAWANTAREVLIYAATRGSDPISILPVIKPSLQGQPNKQITCAAPPATAPWPHSSNWGWEI